jgi:hypothetical protein
MEITTWGDVRAEIARRAAVEKQTIAIEMGYRPDVFSRIINADADSLPTSAWVERFIAALEAVTSRTVAR